MEGRARSRSPRRSEWISRAIVSFGRYPERRPPGLRVGPTGAIVISSLLEVWGRSKGLSGEDIIGALKAHMFDEKRGAGQLRFTIMQDAAGEFLVKVKPKQGRGPATPASANRPHPWLEQPQQPQQPQHQKQQQQPQQPQQQHEWDRPGNQQEDRNRLQQQPQTPPKKSAWAKDPSWDCKPWGAGWGAGDRKAPPWKPEGKEKARGWERHSWAPAPVAKSGGGTRPRQEKAAWPASSSAGSQKQRASGETVQRWLAWALAVGHGELGIQLQEGGCARLADLAAALGRSRADLGISDEASLGALLEETDRAGRFEVDREGCVRKLHREQRRPRQPNRAGPDTTTAGPAASASTNLASATPVPVAPAAPSSLRPPEGPPGDHWTRYTDDGTLWWYYEGPGGIWWCTDSDRKVLPFEDEP